MTCSLKKCQGKRGCLCPKNLGSSLSIVSYSGGGVPKVSSKTVLKSNPIGTTTASKLKKVVTNDKKKKLEKKDSKDVKAVEVQKPRTIIEEAEFLLSQPETAELGESGNVKVKFSIYNKSFPVHNGVLKWSSIDDEYAISFVYRGNFARDLIMPPAVETADISRCDWTKLRRDELGLFFLGVSVDPPGGGGVGYELVVMEDEEAGIGAEGLRLHQGPLNAAHLTSTKASSIGDKNVLKSGNGAVQDITNELKNMSADQLHSKEAKELIERRDLEDVLFS